jgi:DNA end-binding protein Ku
MRAIWKGTISFSLVNIPISLYPATKRDELSFRLLRKTDLSPIKYQRVAETDGKEVPWQEIVKGYEYDGGKVVVMTQEDFKRADVDATQSVDITEFVSEDEIDPMFYDRPYYLEPQKKGAKAYALLREALRRTRKVGIAKVVIKTRQHLAAIRPEQNALVLELMHFPEELIEPKSLDLPGDTELGEKELDMACELVERMTGQWQPSKYKDDYRESLMKLIDEKIKHGGQTPAGTAPSKRQATKMIDLASVLKESLEHAGKGSARQKLSNAKKHRKTLKKAA